MNLNNSPMHNFFVFFILDTIKELPEEKLKIIKKIDFKEIFGVKTEEWRQAVKNVLRLSNTIEISIKDLWLKNSEIAYNKEIKLSPEDFATLFIENFYKKNSKIDVWENKEDLKKAKNKVSNSYLG